MRKQFITLPLIDGIVMNHNEKCEPKEYGIPIENIVQIESVENPSNGFVTKILMKDMYVYYSKLSTRMIVELINN
jgi:hypothetical protein